ncbi:redox-regulated ATPase YchF [Candidatus Wolfebacteria bacterium]|nr:redox-regulated ATPase YchF [Candidatus Wolfebacteria bacterium]
MKLSIGIVGLPNVGKSTLFKILTKQEVNIANYPFATIDPNVGIVSVPDERMEKLAKLSSSKKIVPAIVEFYDIAGLVKGANKGEGLGNQFLSHIRETNAIVHIVRCFKSSEIIHVETEVNPIRDLEIINTELILKDLETVEKRLSSLEKETRTGDKRKFKDLEILKKIRDGLNKNILIINSGEETASAPITKELNFLTVKPQIYLLNGDEKDVSPELKEKIKFLGADYLIINLTASDADGINKLIKKTYEILGLISFLTTGEDETRAWTIKKETKAPQAAGEIHGDFEKKFIKAEVINWQKLLEAGSWASAKQKGLIRLEGKEYVVQDGDVMIIKHG